MKSEVMTAGLQRKAFFSEPRMELGKERWVHGVEGLKGKWKGREEKVHPGFINPERRFELMLFIYNIVLCSNHSSFAGQEMGQLVH